MSHPFDLTGKRILVTGASSGIGRAVAIECSKMGADIILLGRNEERLRETLEQLHNHHNHHQYFSIELLGELNLEELSEYISNTGKLDGLVNCAGVTSTLPIKSISKKRLNEIFEINVFGAIEISKWFTKKSIVNETGGTIIFLTSIMANMGEVGKTMYSMSKGALLSGMRSMALELAPKKIRVNVISPGVIYTPMVENGVYAQDPKLFENVVMKHPLGLGEVNDVANAVIYFMSDASKWVTGTNFVIDGGYTAGK